MNSMLRTLWMAGLCAWAGAAFTGEADFVLQAEAADGAITLDRRTDLEGVPLYPGATEQGVILWDSELYWILPDSFPAGTYTIALRHGGASQSSPGEFVFYVNDRLGAFGSSTLPRYLGEPVGPASWRVQCWLAEQYSAQTWALQPGDMIRLIGRHARVLDALHFHRTPVSGPVPLIQPPTQFKRFNWRPDLQRWQTAMQTDLPSAPGGEATVTFTVRNVSGRALNLEAHTWIVDYFQAPAGAADTRPLTLDNLASVEIPVTVATGATPHYQVRLRLRDTDGYEETFVRDVHADVVTGDRRHQRLDGAWEWQWQPGIVLADRPPEEGEWEPTEVPPKRWTLNPHREKYCGWYRRSFEAPEIPEGARVFLHFERVDYDCRVFLNGAEVGGNHGGYFPFDVEITGHLQPGQNRLEVGVRNWISVLSPEFFARPDAEDVLRERLKDWASVRSDIFDYRINVVAFPNKQEHQLYWQGLGGIEHAVWLETRPRVEIADVFVKPSVREETVTADLTLVNAGDAEQRLTVRNRILRGGEPVRTLPEQTVTVAPGAEAPVSVSVSAQGLAFWDQDDPVLHTLETEVVDAGAPDRTLDRLRTRFGYRELWVDGSQFVLNHKPIKLRSAGGGGGQRSTWDSTRDGMAESVARGTTGFRTHLAPGVPSFVYDIADEFGLIGKPELCVNQGDSWKNPRFWENHLEKLRKMVWRDRNRPSVAFWAAHNEWSWHYSPDEMMAHFYEAVEVIHEIDPTRLVEFEGGGDQRGRMSYFSWHYPNRYWDPLAGKPWMEDRRHGETYGVSNYTVLSGSKPDSAGEMAWNAGIHITGFTQYGGDDVYTFPGLGNAAGFVAYQRHAIDQLRDLEYVNIHPWQIADHSVATYFRPVRAVARDWDSAFRGGEPIVRRFNLHHDVRSEGAVDLDWELRVGDRPVAEGAETFTMTPAELRRIEFEAVLPEVSQREEGVFRVRVRAEGETVVTESPLSVFPQLDLRLPEGVRFGLFDPDGETRELFSEAGFSAQAVDDPNADVLAALDVLVIGRYAAADPKLAARTLEIGTFVERGGMALVLEQKQPFQWLPMWLPMDDTRTAAISFPRALDHPVLRGIGRDDLKFWHGDLLSSRYDYLKPSAGNFVVIADGPGQGGLEWAPIIEVLHGEGRYLCSQMLIHEKWKTEPAAAQLLANLLDYAGTVPYRRLGRFGVIAADDHPLRAFLDEVGLSYFALPVNLRDVNLAEFRVVLIDGAIDPAPHAATLRDFVEQGGALVVHRIPEETHASWETVFEAELEAVPTPSSALMFLDPADPFWGGLAQHDFFWYGYTRYFSPASDQLATLVERPLRPPAVYGSFPEPAANGPLSVPSALLRFQRGEGQFIVDQVCWSQPGLLEKLPEKAPRVVSQMITALGGSFGQEVTIPRTITGYTTVSLAPYANRTFEDDVAEDGLGGWTDQGENDLRTFPTGKVTLEGVPFDIPTEGNTCIILRSAVNRPLNRVVPEAVTGIAVNAAADFVFFLHTSAWGGAASHQFDYIVRYEDGSEELVPVIGGDNIADWWSPNAPVRRAQVAWQGRNPLRDPIGVFLFRWTNRFPEKTIREIDMRSRMSGATIPILVGITLGHAGEDAVLTTEYRTLDLAAVANRPLRDDPEAGRAGGWLDRGADDLRELSVGTSRFAGIPFYIDLIKGCVVLQSVHHPELPERVDGIRIDGPAARLHFLHGGFIETEVPGGLVGGMMIAEYVIHYEDGGSVRFPVVADRHLRNYSDPPRDCPAAAVAWTGSNPLQNTVSLYVATWENSEPGRPLSHIELVSARAEGTLATLAVTAVVDRPLENAVNRLDNPGMEAVRPLDERARERFQRHRAATFEGAAFFPLDWTLGSHNPDQASRVIAVTRDARNGQRALRLHSEGRVTVAAPETPVATQSGRIYRLGVYARGQGRLGISAGLRPAPEYEGSGFAHLDQALVGPDWQAFYGRYVQAVPEMSHWGRRQDAWRAAALSLRLEIRGDIVLDDAFLMEEPLYETQPHPRGAYIYEIVRGTLVEAEGRHPVRVTRGMLHPDDLGLWCEAGDRVELTLRMPAGRYRVSVPVTQNRSVSFRGDPQTGNLPSNSIELRIDDQSVDMHYDGPLRLLAEHEGYATLGQNLQSKERMELQPGGILTLISLGRGGIGPVRLL